MDRFRNGIVRLADGVSLRSLGDSGLLLREGDGQMYTLNATGLAFVEGIDGQRSFAQLLDLVDEQFDVPDRAELESDMAALVEELEQQELVERAGG